jgi:hypothetical protein
MYLLCIYKKNDKLDRNSVKIIFLGYSSEKKGYKCYDPKNHKIYFSRDILFSENEPYYQSNDQESSQINSYCLPTILLPNAFICPQERNKVQIEHVKEEQIDETSTISLEGEEENETSEEPSQDVVKLPNEKNP